MHVTLSFAAALGALTLVAGCGAEDDRPETADYIIAAILKPQCATPSCHSSGAQTKGFIFDTLVDGREALNFLVVAGEPEASQLLAVIGGLGDFTPDYFMPPDSPMPDADIELIRRWILGGARGL